MPVAWSFDFGRGEIQTSPRGWNHELLDALDFSGSVICFPAHRRTESRPLRPWRRQPPLRAMRAVYPLAIGSDTWQLRRSPVLRGDETGQELLEGRCRVLDREVIGLDVDFDRFDLSLEDRQATKNQVVYDAAAAIAFARSRPEGGDGEPEGAEDVGVAEPDTSQKRSAAA